MAISFQNVAGNLQAPDITKAGGIIAKAISGIGTAGQAIVTGQQSKAANTFDNAVRGASSLDELEAINTDGLIKSGVDSQTLAAAEGAKTNKQVDIFDKNRQVAFDQQISANAPIAQSILDSNPVLADTISIDQGNNPIFFANPLKPTDLEKANKRTYIEGLKNSELSPIQSSQEYLAEIRKNVTAFGGSEEDVQRLVASAKRRRSDLSTLDDNQQAQVAVAEQGIAQEALYEIEQEDFAHQQRVQAFGMQPTEAAARLTVSRNDLFSILSGKEYGEELGFSDFFTNTVSQQSAGIDIKEKARALMDADPSIQPWMIMQAINETLDTEPGAVNVDNSEFEDVVNQLNTPEKIAEMNAISTLDRDSNLRKMAINSAAEFKKGAAVLRLKGQFGIQNFSNNAQLFNSVLQRANAVQDKSSNLSKGDTQAPVTNTSQAIPDGSDFKTGYEGLTVSEAKEVNGDSILQEDVDSVQDADARKVLQDSLNNHDPQETAKELARAGVRQEIKQKAKLETVLKDKSTLINGKIDLLEATLATAAEEATTGSKTKEELTKIADKVDTILRTREGSTTPLSISNQTKLLDLQLETLIELGATKAQIEEATIKVNTLKERIRNRKE